MPKSLFFRLMGAFALVILVGVAVVYVIGNQTTTSEFQLFMFRGQMVAARMSPLSWQTIIGRTAVGRE